MSTFDRVSPNLKDRPPMKSAVLLEPDKDTEVWEVSSINGVKSYWKALDIPYPNTLDFRQMSQEMAVLNIMAGKPGFSTNWRWERSNWRQWLVRDPMLRTPEDYEPWQIGREGVLELEQSLRELNSLGWTIGKDKPVSIMVIPETFEPVFVGLSGVHEAEDADDIDAWVTWLKESGFRWLVTLRVFGEHHTGIVAQAQGEKYQKGHVYVALNRPVVETSKLPEEALVLGTGKRLELGSGVGLWSSVLLPREHAPLDEDVIKALELTWAWSPIRYEEKSDE